MSKVVIEKPFAIVPMGYPLEAPKQPNDRYKPEKIHWGTWESTDSSAETAAE